MLVPEFVSRFSRGRVARALSKKPGTVFSVTTRAERDEVVQRVRLASIGELGDVVNLKWSA